jgi:putative ATP-dependent endonuclease of OLD family
MRLKEIGIKNLKGLKEAVFNPTSFTCLVGENNAGKSTVLQAIATALNRPSQLPANLFYDTALPIDLALEFDSVTPADLLRLVEEHRSRN